jgi:hypothetical protein
MGRTTYPLLLIAASLLAELILVTGEDADP